MQKTSCARYWTRGADDRSRNHRFASHTGAPRAVLMETSMLKATLLLLIAAEIILGGQAFAADAASESGWIVGVGQHSCGTFLLALRVHFRNVFT